MFLFVTYFCFFLPSLLREEASSSSDSMEEMERLYLQMCHEAPSSARPGSSHPADTARANGQFAAIPSLRTKVEQLLLSMADHLLNCYSPDVSSTCCST